MDRLLSATVTDGSSGQGQYSKVAAGSESYTHNAIGNLLSKTGVGAYTYGTQAGDCPEGALSKPHAVVTAGSNTYCYDQNGHLRRRKSGATTYTLTYDAENRLIGVSGGTSASFVYDGDGRRVKATFGTETTVYIGDYYEQTGSMIKKYYYAGGQRVAMRENSILYWLLTDRLGSTAITAYLGGDKKAEIRYKAWGRIGTPTAPRLRPISSPGSDGMLLGLYFYKARYYDPALGRWTQPDTVVPNPGNPQDLNRFSYVRNSPLRYTDPTGHWIFEKEPDDPFIWSRDNPAGTLIRSAEPVVFWEETQEPNLAAPFVAIYGSAVAGVAAEVAVVDLAVPAAQTAWGQAALRLGPLGEQAWERGQDLWIRWQATQRLAQNRAQGLAFQRQVLQARGLPENWRLVEGAYRTREGLLQVGRARPDVLTDQLMMEAKSGAYVANTRQMQILTNVAEQEGLRFELVVNMNTRVSEPLKERITKGIGGIIWRFEEATSRFFEYYP